MSCDPATLDRVAFLRSISERVVADMEDRGFSPDAVAHFRALIDAKEIAALDRMAGEPLSLAEYADLWRALAQERIEAGAA